MPLDAAVVLGITATALLVWSADPLLNQVKEHLGHVPLTHVSSITVESGRFRQPISITVEGGHTAQLEGRGAAHELAAAFGTRGTSATV